jgi:hypothetical protein
MAEAMHRARAGGWDEVTLWVLAGNARARAFYHHLGLRADGTQMTHLGTGLPEIRLRAGLAG